METFKTPDGKPLEISRDSLRTTAQDSIALYMPMLKEKGWIRFAKEQLKFWNFMLKQTNYKEISSIKKQPNNTNMETKKKTPSKAQLEARAKFIKMVKEKAAAKKKAGLNAPAKRVSAKKMCRTVIKVEGVKTDGTLKKGYKYAKGGKVVKAKPAKKVTTTKKKVVKK